MRPKNQLVNPPKIKKFNSICVSNLSVPAATLTSDAGPIELANQSGSSRHMTCKMAGNGPSGQGSHADIGIGLQEGLAYCYIVLPIDIENPYRLSNCLYR